MKKLLLMLILLMIGAMVFSGCAVIVNLLDPLPDEYVDGVRVSRDYPDDQLEIYDDAIVFESEEDDEEVVIKFGTQDDIDDVIDFYEDLFEDNNLTIDEQEDSRDKFYAEGKGDEFKFEIFITEAKGDYEERAFATVVEITTEPFTLGEEILEKMQGFWLICGLDGEILDDYRMAGQAIDFNGMKMDTYNYFELETPNNDFVFLDDNTINYFLNGEEYTVEVSFETVDSINYMGMSIDGATIYLEKSTYNAMLAYQDMPGEEDLVITLEEYLSDEDLEYYISDLDWYLTYYYYADNSFDYAEDYNRMYFDYYYTGTDEYEDGESYEITWYVYDSILYLMYDDGTSYDFLVDYEQDDTGAYMYLFDSEAGYSDIALVYTLD